MLGQNSSDMIIHHHNFVDIAKPLHREHSYTCRTTSNTHQFFFFAIHNGGFACFNNQLDLRLIFTDLQFHSFTIAKAH